VAPDLLKVTPGIRPTGAAMDDQRRTATPREAVERGADYLVIGRPIVRSPDPVGTARAIVEGLA
jgi:orotidine-5'-phosphate decarboxylase